MTNTVIGFFKNSSDAYNAADVLKDRGFDINNVDISTSYGTDEDNDKREERSGKIAKFFKNLFSDNDKDADRYSSFARDNSMVTVYAYNRDEAERAADILDSCGAVDIDDSGATDLAYDDRSGSITDRDYDLTGQGVTNLSYDDDMKDHSHVASDFDESGLHDADSDFDRTGRFSSDLDSETDRMSSDLDTDAARFSSDLDRDTSRFSSDKDRDEFSDTSIPIIEEEVNVGKREVRRGGVRLRSRIVEKPVEETLRLREEQVRIERTPADRDALDSDLDNFHEETIEVHEYGEEPIVSKKSRVVEEVKVGKDVHERHETIHEKARKTEVDIEKLDEEEQHTKHRRKR